MPILGDVTNLYTNDYPDDGMGATPGAPDQDPLGRGRRKRPGPRVAALIAACAVVAGGAFAVTEAVSRGGPGTPVAAATGSAATPVTGLTGQAAVLNGALADASFASAVPTGAAADHETAAARQALRRLRRAIARLRALGGMYGQYTFQTREGPRTLAFERGAIISIAGADVTVRASNGAIWTWTLTGSSVVRQDGTREPATALAPGKQVFAAGSVSGATRDAVLIVIRPPAKPS